jgi:hypothetical protein
MMLIGKSKLAKLKEVVEPTDGEGYSLVDGIGPRQRCIEDPQPPQVHQQEGLEMRPETKCNGP